MAFTLWRYRSITIAQVPGLPRAVNTMRFVSEAGNAANRFNSRLANGVYSIQKRYGFAVNPAGGYSTLRGPEPPLISASLGHHAPVRPCGNCGEIKNGVKLVFSCYAVLPKCGTKEEEALGWPPSDYVVLYATAGS